jgi:transposase
MSSSLPDDINALKRLLAEQEALNRALLEKLNEREREIDHLQAQLDKLRRMNFGSRSEKVSRRIAQMEADLKALQKESDTLTGRVTTRPCSARCVKPAPANRSPNHSRDEKRLLPAASCCPECGGSLSYLGEDAAEQLELMRTPSGLSGLYVKSMPVLSAMPSCRPPRLHGPSSGVSQDRGCWPAC